MSEIDYAARVAKGVALLDEKRPGWERLINLGKLDIENGSCCITAQLSGAKHGVDSWVDGMQELDLTDGNDGSYVAHGFNSENCEGDCYGGPACPQPPVYVKLNTLWREVIQGRLAAG